MAIASADGSIILSTKVDTSGINKGMSQMQGKATSLTKTFSKLGAAIASAFAIQKIIQFSNEAGQLATQTEASVQRLVDIYGSASDSVGDFIDANARALGMSKAAAASFSSVYGNLFSVWADQATNAELTNRYLNMTAVVASKTGRTVEDVQERVRSGLLGNTEAIEDLGIFVNVKTIEMTDAFQRMANGKSWEQLDAYTQQQIRSMAILEQATAKYGDEVADTSATIRNRFNAAYQDFQNSWGNIVNTVLLPVLETLTQIFDIATKGLNALSGRSGQILENVELQEENSNKTAENIEEQTKNQKELNKELKKSTASFDDIEIISSNLSEGDATKTPFELPETNGGSSGGDGDDSAFERTQEKIKDLAKIVSGAMIAMGCILLATGNIGWGIGLIITGAAAEGIVEASDDGGASFDTIKEKISKAITIAGTIAIVLGILLCMAQMWGLGIKLIAIGATSIVSSITLNWDSIKNAIVEQKERVTIAGALLVALGILLCIAGAWALGIGAIVAGGAFIATEVALNWDAIKQAIAEQSGRIAIAGLLLVVVGILVCFVNLPLGIGLIAAGAASLVTVTALNRDAIVDWIKGAWEAVKAFWNRYIAPVFTARFWLDLAKNCGNGLIGGFEAAINGIIGMFEKMINWIVNGLNKISFDIPDWLGGGSFGINIPNVSFGRVSIPRLAQGAVIPPNREFLAVLGDQKHGTNIEAPLQTIVDAFNIALAQNGGNYGGGNTEVVLEIDGREFGRAVVEQGNRENRRIGTRLVIA